MNLINERQKKAIINAYSYRLKATNIDFDNDLLEKKLIKLSENELNDFLTDIIRTNSNHMINALNKLNIPAVDKQKQINELSEKLKKRLNLSDITEFSKDKKAYFKFKDSDRNVAVVRNLGQDSRELFMSILNDTNGTDIENGKVNISEIFKFSQNKKFIEIPMENSKKIDANKHHKAQITIIRELEKQFSDKEIMVSTEQNIYIVKNDIGKDDIILSITKQNGKYKVVSLHQKTYGENVKDNNKESFQTKNEVPNDIVIELENNEEIINLIEEGLNKNLSDEEIQKRANDLINQKYAKFNKMAKLHEIIVNMINKKKKNNSQSSKGGRQYVLKSNNSISYTEDNEAA